MGYFPFPERSGAIEMLSSYVAEQIDDVEVNCLELENKYPSLGLALNKKREMALTILDLAVKKCQAIKYLTIHEHHRILRSLQPVVFERLKSINVGKRSVLSQPIKKFGIKLIPEEIPSLFVRTYLDHHLNIEVKFEAFDPETSLESLDTVLKCSERWGRSVHLHLFLWDPFKSRDPSLLRTQWPSVHALDCSHSVIMPVDFLFWMIPKFPQLVKLFLNNCNLNPQDISSLARICSQGTLRKLSTIDINNNGDVGGNLAKILCSSFQALDTLLLSSCGLGSDDLASLARVGATGILPKLSTLDISNNINISGNLSVLFSSTYFPSLHSLFLNRCDLNALDVSSIAQARVQALLPQLKNLDVSFNFNPHSPNAVKSNSGVLCMFPRLDTLVMCGCRLLRNHLYHIHQRAITDGDHFAELTSFDISSNPGIGRHLSELMCNYFPNLRILVLRKCELNPDDLSSLTQVSSLWQITRTEASGHFPESYRYGNKWPPSIVWGFKRFCFIT